MTKGKQPRLKNNTKVNSLLPPFYYIVVYSYTMHFYVNTNVLLPFSLLFLDETPSLPPHPFAMPIG